jgi:bile acid-coenzyme A ligase
MIPLGAIPAHHAMRLGARTAVTQDDIGLDWPALEAAANRFANAMTVRGVGRDDMVTVALPNGNAFFAVVFGLWKIGATPNPVSSKTPVRELRAVLQVVRPKLVICSDAALAAALDGVTLDFAEGASGAPVNVEVARHWKAMPSGGSTGAPKVIVDHRPAAFDPDEPKMGIPSDGVLLNPGPLWHNAPFSISTAGLVRGSTVVSMRRFDAEEALRLIDRHRVQFVNFVPTMMHRIWRLPEEFRSAYDLSSLERVWHMAVPMPPWLKRAWIDWLGADHVWELYGGTENTGSTVISGSEWLQRPGSVGRPTAGARIRAQDEAGYVFLADRRTDLIISGGANIYPAEVEAAILEHPRVAGAVVIGLPDEDLGARAHAILRLTPGVGPDDIIANLLSWLETRFARYKIPRTFEATDEELRDDAGKVRRSALRAARLKA